MATYTFDKIEYGGNIYVPDFLPLVGGTVTGPVTFGDTITADEATLGSLTVSGSASVANNLQVNTINGVSVGNSPKFTDTIIDGVGALSKNGNNLQVNYNDGTAVRKINSINAATFSDITGVSILYDNGTVDGGWVFLPDGNGFATGSQNIINQIPSITLNGSANTSPSFYAPTGAGTSGNYLKSSGSGAPTWATFPTIPSITLNGSATTSPSFYAPTGAGTSGQYLKSSGSGAPTWTNFPTIPSITLNGSSITSPSFYAPTGAGTNGYVLKSNGNGAPSWTSAVLTDENVKITALTSASTYYLTGNNSFGTNTGGLNVHASASLAISGDSSTNGYTRLQLGNDTASTSTGGREGVLRLYGTSTSYTDLKVGASTSAKTITFPDKTGTVALTSDIPTVPTITLNGSSTMSPSFYAPTGAGTSGQYLKSSGSGAPTWTNFPTIPTIPSNNVTGSGTSGQLAQWNGTNTLTSGPKITYSTSAPSGGSNGDIWFVIG